MKSGPQFSTLFQKFSFGFSLFMIIFCGGLIVTYIAELLVHENKHPVSSQVGLMFFLAGLIVVCLRIVRIHLSDSKAVRELKEEQSILNRARQRKRPLTITETALDCQMRISDTKKAFERLSLTGVCQIDVTEEGELCYIFPSFESDSRKITLDESPISIKKEQPELS
ncbi:MAG: hypothetical protein K2X77_12395 [Candidatus Obscuribacterales bacterium]|nr:hypothetical protein [Candidatus Obscuribacterales bacterium]